MDFDKDRHDESYMEIARVIAKRSYAKKKQVGAIIVKNRAIISDGYNGTPAGFDNECEIPLYDRGLGYPDPETEDWLDTMTAEQREIEVAKMYKPIGWHTKPHVLHAEANAITKLARSTNSSEGSTLYLTWSPCLECAKLIIQAGIRRVVVGEHYKKPEGMILLEKAKVKITRLYSDDAKK